MRSDLKGGGNIAMSQLKSSHLAIAHEKSQRRAGLFHDLSKKT